MITTNPTLSLKDLFNIILKYYRNDEKNCESTLKFCSSGSIALIEVLKELEIKSGEKILLPAYICESIPKILKHYNYEVIFVDSNKNLDFSYQEINKIISLNNVKAVLLVDYFGFKKKSNKVLASKLKNLNCKVIIDRCHTVEKTYNIYEDQYDAIIYSFRKIIPVYNGGAYWYKNSAKKKIKINKFEMSDLFFVIYHLATNILKKIELLKYFYILRRARNTNSKLKSKKNKFSINFLLHYFYFNSNLMNQVILSRQQNFNKIFDICYKSNIQSFFHKCDEDEVPQLYPIIKKISLNEQILKSHGINSFNWPGKELPQEVRNSTDFPIANYLNHNLLMLPIHQKLSKGDLKIIKRVLLNDNSNY